MFKRALVLALLLLPITKTMGQESNQPATQESVAEVKDAVTGINETIAEMKTVLDALSKLKVSGYIQSQLVATNGMGGWNGAATSGPAAVGNYSGGAMTSGLSSRMYIRRGRIKFAYAGSTSTQYVVQFDITQSGVSTKDVYFKYTEPWLKTVSLTTGVFDRPFGFEISYSSSSRETPERSRMFQTLFPGERDLGMMLTVEPQQGVLSKFNLKAGIFNGNGIAVENDRNKDIIGRLGMSLPFEEVNLAIDGGISMYSGKVRSGSKYIYSKVNTVDSTTTNLGKNIERSYLGLDAQLYYDAPVIGGLSLRAEYIKGKQPGTVATSHYYSSASDPLYLRNFQGYYICYVQNIGLSHQFVFKYDVFDPNIDASAKNIGASGSKMGLGDLRYTTTGIGWVYYFDPNIKLVVYYEMVKNDTVAQTTTSNTFKPYKEDIKDDVLTVRMQYKF